MIRVVHVINIDIGVRIHLRNQLVYLKERGYDVSVVCAPGPLIPVDEITPEGIPVYTIPMTRDIRPLKDLIVIAQLTGLFRRKRFDIVHTHSTKPGVLGRIAARLAGTPCIVHTVHGLLLHEGITLRGRWLWKAGERIGAAFGDYMLSQSRRDMEVLVNEGICGKRAVGHLGNGIDLSEFDPDKITPAEVRAIRERLGVAETDKVIGISGRLGLQKGYFEFAKMARTIHKEYPNTKFWMMGRMEIDKPDGLAVEDIITGDMNDYVRYLGQRSDMPCLLGAMDIFVFPSHREGMPRSLMEAAAMGKPIVASDIDGCREVIEHNLDGLLTPVGDANGLTKAVKSLLENPTLADGLATAARAHAHLHFDERIYFSKVETTYESLLLSRGLA